MRAACAPAGVDGHMVIQEPPNRRIFLAGPTHPSSHERVLHDSHADTHWGTTGTAPDARIGRRGDHRNRAKSHGAPGTAVPLASSTRSLPIVAPCCPVTLGDAAQVSTKGVSPSELHTQACEPLGCDSQRVRTGEAPSRPASPLWGPHPGREGPDQNARPGKPLNRSLTGVVVYGAVSARACHTERCQRLHRQRPRHPWEHRFSIPPRCTGSEPPRAHCGRGGAADPVPRGTRRGCLAPDAKWGPFRRVPSLTPRDAEVTGPETPLRGAGQWLTPNVADEREWGQVEGAQHRPPADAPDVLQASHEQQPLVLGPARDSTGAHRAPRPGGRGRPAR